MPKLPVLSGKELAKTFSKLGYFIDHQTGSHFILRQKQVPHRRLVIPNHSTLAKGTLSAIIKESGITREQLLDML